MNHRHTEINAGQSATLISGRDTTLSGAQVSGERIVAQVQLDEEKAGMSLQDFLSSPDGNKLAGPTGGVQGYKGTLFGIPYEAGSWQDKLIEAFAGTHDFIGGKLSGLYDEEGNAVRGRSAIEKFAHDRWSEAAIPISAPFAAAQALPPQVWQSLSVLLRNAK